MVLGQVIGQTTRNYSRWMFSVFDCLVLRSLLYKTEERQNKQNTPFGLFKEHGILGALTLQAIKLGLLVAA